MADQDVQVATNFSAQAGQLASLIASIAGGDEQALGILYDRTSSYVYGLIFRVLNDPGAAEEVTLDVYMQVWRLAKQFDEVRGGPIAWLGVLARSRAIDRLRSGQKEREKRQPLEIVDEVPSTLASPEESSAYNEQCRVVQSALASLVPEQRHVIELAYFGGLTHSEIAAEIRVPLGTVKTRARLGMMKLRKILSPLEEGLAP
ncbi:MAG: sigma-70 family RNA polymerase sigma factor [Nitrospirales bacterium]|nr:sigma-70 family RNA polymerase sigma factor [Nitrospira sp.]MDR4502174.1 sigma-70 family RNA polymerase sigma factor [Nitrospirales bacterium]